MNRMLFNTTKESSFTEWLAGALASKGVSLTEAERAIIQSKLKETIDSPKDEFFPSMFPPYYITVHTTPLWPQGKKFSGYSLPKENLESILAVFGGESFGGVPNFVVENTLAPKVNGACFCGNLSVNRDGNGMAGLHKGGVGMSNVGVSSLIC